MVTWGHFDQRIIHFPKKNREFIHGIILSKDLNFEFAKMDEVERKSWIEFH